MWYVIQVLSGQEEAAVQLIQKFVDEGSYEELFVPYCREMRKIDGAWQPALRKLTPGYIVIITKTITKVEAQLRKVPTLTKLLGSEGSFTPLSTAEVKWFDKWTSRNGRIIDISTGLIERGKVQILSGPLTGHEGEIVRINRRKRQATVRLTFMGREQDLQFALELVKSDPR